MKVKQTTLKSLLTLTLFMAVSLISAQTFSPSHVRKAVKFDISPRLKDITPVPPGTKSNREVPNKFDFDEEGSPRVTQDGPDPVLQTKMTTRRDAPVIGENFDGVHNQWGIAPPDTEGDVSPDYYFQMINLGFAIYAKDGTLVYGPANNITIWNGFPGPWSSTNDGDPVVLYDEHAGRWIATQFSMPNGQTHAPFYELVAVSVTDDPTGSWYRYAFEYDMFPDYPKFGVWEDGYYMAANYFDSGNWHGGGVCIFDRDAMIDGDPEATMLYFDVGSGYGSMLPADVDGDWAPEGSPNYLLSLGGSSLRLIEAHVDWENTDNSTVGIVGTIPVASYSNVNFNIRQPGTGTTLDDLADRLMYRLQYRNFGSYQVMMTNHSVNVGSGRAGVRWYEMRNYGDGWEMYQQGTFAPDDNNSRWMASVAMNADGVIMAGYSISGTSTYPSIMVSGQTAENSGTGEFDIPETTVFNGTHSQTGVDRWGDYSMMAVDPTDDRTFWFTTEYSNGSWNWRTRIASISYAQQPVADFEASDTLIPLNENIDFTDLSTGGPSSWDWTFYGGDPETSSEQNPSGINYANEGSFDVRLIVTNNVGTDTIIKEGYINVSATLLPEVDFVADKQYFCSGDTVFFTDLTVNSPTAWEWAFTPEGVTFVNGTNQNSQNPVVMFNNPNTYSVTLTAWNTNGPASLTKENYINSGGFTPYFLETFEDDSPTKDQWTIENPDGDKTWEYFETGGTTPGNTSVGIDFSNYYEQGARDRLVSPLISLVGLSTANLSFQHAYAKKFSGATDSLIIYISDDCGETWTRIFEGGEDGTGNFATHEMTSDFWPEVESDWCMSGWGASCFDIDISQWAGEGNIRIAFESYCYWGNPLFIDNVEIEQYVGIPEDAGAKDDIQIYPNPSDGRFTIDFGKEHNFNSVEVINQLGEVLYKETINSQTKSLTVGDGLKLAKGVYFIRLKDNANSIVRKVMIK